MFVQNSFHRHKGNFIVEVEGGAWFKFDEVKGFTLRTREEIIDKVR